MPAGTFAPDSAVMGFDINESPLSVPIGDIFCAEFGSEIPEAIVTKIDFFTVFH
ncbi:hypothetical protein [Neobacillus mesonae]|uniref:hypothetical protein n=1 Tax=Neobacillus mesonae TaxID=1193713 RepID=UPI00203D60BA|nr:hypothetical protein [Neobacillus mesonae]